MALIGRELAEAIDHLILTRIAEHQYEKGANMAKFHKDDAELIKREITDALLAMDRRRGVYVSGQPIHSR